MKYVFYADIFFITNFIMDFMVLKLAGLIRKKKIHTTSYLFGSFFGAAVLTLSVMCPVDLGIAGEIAVYLVVSYLMCMITFGRTGWKENIQSWLAMYGMAVCTGGIMNMAYFRFRLNLVTFLVPCGNQLCCHFHRSQDCTDKTAKDRHIGRYYGGGTEK